MGSVRLMSVWTDIRYLVWINVIVMISRLRPYYTASYHHKEDNRVAGRRTQVPAETSEPRRFWEHLQTLSSPYDPLRLLSEL